jgi:predicted ATPase/class 3 adenylate cyclase
VRPELPTGTVTFVFTDVEGSTNLLHKLGPAGYADVLDTHRRLIRAACARHAGAEVDTQGDAFFFAFATAPAALSAAVEMTRALASGPIRVRIGVHTGTPLLANEGYVGVDVHRAARIAASGHGGQVLVSQSTAALVDWELRDLGEHRFKDLLAPERIYQLGTEDFPAIRSLERSNLPVAAWPLLGRERELGEITGLVDGGARLVTLTGPGGTGKTRLALQAAAELSDRFRDGTFFVALGPVRDASAVYATVARATGLEPDEDVVAWLAGRNMLLALDNLEHLPGVAPIVSELLTGGVVVLATSRAPLHLSSERELPIEPLPSAAAVELFLSRAAAAGARVNASAEVEEVCRRLDNLPLAVELAAARAKVLSPAALLERLDAALPLLTGGALDLPERQRTLRATIEWSHELLSPETRAAFRRLAVFRGPFTLEGAETIAAAPLDQVETLVDQSLLKSIGDSRFFLLETLREYAREQLAQAGETTEYELRHARWYLARLEEIEPELRGPRTAEFVSWYIDEEDNLRAMVDRLVRLAPIEAARAAHLLWPYWFARGGLEEGRARMDALLAKELPPTSRAVVLRRLGDVETHLGHLDAAARAATEAFEVAEGAEDGQTAAHALRVLAHVELRRGDLDEAARRARQALEHPASDSALRAMALGDLGLILTGSGRDDEARTTLHDAETAFRGLGETVNAGIVRSNLAELDLFVGDFESAHTGSAGAVATGRETGHQNLELMASIVNGEALLGLGRPAEAREVLTRTLDLAVTVGGQAGSLFLALGVVALAADEEDIQAAARLRGAAAGLRRAAELEPERRQTEFEQPFEQALIDKLDAEAWAAAQAEGGAMTLEEAVVLARSLCDERPSGGTRRGS